MTTFGPYPGIVDHVHDGDTVYVRLGIDQDFGFDLHFAATVFARCRIIGINAPELSTPEGIASRDFARTLLTPGMIVRATSYGWDKYGGRIDASIEFGLPVRDFGKEMIAAGQAKPWDGVGVKP